MSETKHTPGPLPPGWTINKKFGLTLTDGEGYSRNIDDGTGKIDRLKVSKVLANYGFGEHCKAWLLSPLEIAAPELLAWLDDALHCLEQYREYGEAMREYGRGFQATGKLGHTIDGVIGGIKATIAQANGR